MANKQTNVVNAVFLLIVAIGTYECLGYQRRALIHNVGDSLPLETAKEDTRICKAIDHVEFENVSVADALQWVADTSGLKLDESGPSADPAFNAKFTTIQLHFKNVSNATILDALLLAVDQHGHPAWTIRDGKIAIEPKEKLDDDQAKEWAKDVSVRTYDVQPLLARAWQPTGSDEFNGDSLYQNNNQSQSQQSARGFTEQQLATEEIRKFITDNVDSPSWKDNGGDIGSIQDAGGFLVIEQTAHAHRQIERLLHLLNGEQ